MREPIKKFMNGGVWNYEYEPSLVEPYIFPCWERFKDGQLLLVSDEAEYKELCSKLGEPLKYTITKQYVKEETPLDIAANAAIRDQYLTVFEAKAKAEDLLSSLQDIIQDQPAKPVKALRGKRKAQ